MTLSTTIRQFWRQHGLGGKFALVVIGMWILAAVASYLPGLTSYAYDEVLGGVSSLQPPLSPGERGIHWLGTDSLGRDVWAGMLHGAGVSLVLSLGVIAASVAIGLLIGMMMGYFGDRGFRLNVPQYIWLFLIVYLLTYYKTDVLLRGWSWWSSAVTVLLTVALFSGWYILGKLSLWRYVVPVDAIWQRVFEVKESLPNLFLLLAIAAIIAKPSVWTLSLTLIVLYWVTFARFARAEVQQILAEDYIAAANAQGLSTMAVMFKHVLPNMINPILVVVAFSLSGVILVEASLSFLGIGLPLGEVTWGKILSEARKHNEAWWLALFPGLAIFALIFAFNKVADIIRDTTYR